METIRLTIHPLTRENFAPFGDVIETEGAHHYPINSGHATRFHDLARLDVLAEGGRPLVNIFRASPWPMPLRVQMMERHPLSSQAFLPLDQRPFLVVAGPPGDQLLARDIQAFISNGRQGVNYHRGAWHYPVLALAENTDFVVIDRGGPGANCDETYFEAEQIILDYRLS